MHNIFVIFLILMSIVGCSSPNEKVYTKSIEGDWNKKQSQDLDFEIENNQSLKNITFIIRNNNKYPYSNIRLIGTIIDGNKKAISTDTLNYILAKPNGQWLGTGFGDTKELEIPYKTDFKFSNNGKYTLKVVQAMRKDQLPGIEDIGIKIVNAKP